MIEWFPAACLPSLFFACLHCSSRVYTLFHCLLLLRAGEKMKRGGSRDCTTLKRVTCEEAAVRREQVPRVRAERGMPHRRLWIAEMSWGRGLCEMATMASHVVRKSSFGFPTPRTMMMRAWRGVAFVSVDGIARCEYEEKGSDLSARKRHMMRRLATRQRQWGRTVRGGARWSEVGSMCQIIVERQRSNTRNFGVTPLEAKKQGRQSKADTGGKTTTRV